MSAEHQNEIAVYKKRWFLLAALCMLSVISQFLSKSFGTSDEILSVYYNVSLTELDWAVEGLYGGTAIITPLFAYLCYKDNFGFRMMTIIGSLCSLISCVAIVLSIAFPSLFPLLLASTFLQGVSYLICLSIGTFFAVLWFPEEQVHLAVACNINSIMIGVLFGSLLPTALLRQPPRNGTNLSLEHTNWSQGVYHALLPMYLVVTFILCFLLLFFVIYADDEPPQPPTVAMLLKRNRDVGAGETAQNKSFREYVILCKLLLKDIHFLMMNFVIGICYNINGLTILSMSQIVDEITRNGSLQLTSAFLSSLIVLIYAFSAVGSGFVVAKYLKHSRIFPWLIPVGTFLETIVGVMYFLSYHYKSLVSLFVANFVLGFGNRCASIPLFVVVTQHTYPINESFVSIWVTGFCSLFFVTFAAIDRAVSNAFSTGSVTIALTIILFTSFLFSLVIKPKNKRREVNETLTTESNELSERSPILSHGSR